MKINKLQPLIILVIGLVLTSILFFVDESAGSFSFLTNGKELVNFIFFAILFTVLPLILYEILNTRFKGNTIYIALLGFIPALVLLAVNIIW